MTEKLCPAMSALVREMKPPALCNCSGRVVVPLTEHDRPAIWGAAGNLILRHLGHRRERGSKSQRRVNAASPTISPHDHGNTAHSKSHGRWAGGAPASNPACDPATPRCRRLIVLWSDAVEGGHGWSEIAGYPSVSS